MKKRSLIILLLLLAFAVMPVKAELIETPAPAPVHVTPAPTPEPPALVDAATDRDVFENLRFKLDAKVLHIWFPSIKNADEAILVCGDEVFLIDCGDKRAAISGAELLQKLGVTKIDKLFNSHPHHDHLRGLSWTNDAAAVRELLVCFPRDSTPTMIEAMGYAATKKIPVSDFTDGDTFTMGEGEITLTFWCNNDPNLDMNNNSAVTLVKHGERAILFTADVEEPGMEVLLQRIPAENLKADIIKYPHHGHPALTDAFMKAVNPKAAIVTNIEVDWTGLKFLCQKKIPVYLTREGDKVLHLYTDGITWVIEGIPLSQVQPIQN